ncbi:MAG TPA: cysteine--1-D-myo-inosityl 2-amino-2-deoxy-alpha-D-glucopyranoside ligase [Frankiaceae bacterium]
MESWVAPSVPQLPGRGYPLRLWDTAAGAPAVLDDDRPLTMYVCGITPYDATHLGHAATYLTFDLVQRVARDAGRDVRYVQNVTDVDDPLFERAARDGVDWQELGAEQTDLFRSDMVALRVLPPEHYVGAIEAMPLIVDAITRLADTGAAYRLDGDVYFDAAATGRLGAVSHLSRDEMLAVAAERGGDPQRPGKRDPLDPLLWLAQRPAEPGWPSPFGPGRPGWHIECTAIAQHYLGPVLDVQGGGADLAFPHHEMGALHGAALTGKWPFARCFAHAAMVRLDGEKMSKSLGNLVFVSKLVAGGTDPAAIRLVLLDQPYRLDWEYTDGHLRRAEERLACWRAGVARPAGPDGATLLDVVRARLADDLDAPGALAAIDAWAATEGGDTAAPTLTRDLVDALLGVAL